MVGSLDDRCSPECPGTMRRLGAMRSLSPARCLGLRDGVSSFRLQGVASMEWVPTRHLVLRRVLVRWSISVYQAVVISPV